MRSSGGTNLGLAWSVVVFHEVEDGLLSRPLVPGGQGVRGFFLGQGWSEQSQDRERPEETEKRDILP